MTLHNISAVMIEGKCTLCSRYLLHHQTEIKVLLTDCCVCVCPCVCLSCWCSNFWMPWSRNFIFGTWVHHRDS